MINIKRVLNICFIIICFMNSVSFAMHAGVKRSGGQLNDSEKRQRVGGSRNRERYFGRPDAEAPVDQSEMITVQSNTGCITLPIGAVSGTQLFKDLKRYEVAKLTVDVFFKKGAEGYFEGLMKEIFYHELPEDGFSYSARKFAYMPKNIGGVLEVALFWGADNLVKETAERYSRLIVQGQRSYTMARQEIPKAVRFEFKTGPFSLQELIDQDLIPKDVAGVKEIHISYPIDNFEGLSRLQNRESLKRIVMTQDVVELDGGDEQEKLRFDRMPHSSSARVSVAKGVSLVR